MQFNRHNIFLGLALVLQAIIFLAWAFPFALPKIEAWQAAAFLSFFASFA